MSFKRGDLITGKKGNLAKFKDLKLSEEVTLEVTEIDNDDKTLYVEVISSPMDEDLVGEEFWVGEKDFELVGVTSSFPRVEYQYPTSIQESYKSSNNSSMNTVKKLYVLGLL